MTESNQPLKPCPFCGSEARIDNGFLPTESIYHVWCSNQECKLCDIEIGFTQETWNTRANTIKPEPQAVTDDEKIVRQYIIRPCGTLPFEPAIAAFNRLMAQRKQPQWQSIETAPTNGTRILFCAKGRVTVAAAQWGLSNCGQNRTEEGWRGWPSVKPPTHWMPLPEEPK